MKKKIFTFVMVLCLIFPFSFMLTGCGHQHEFEAEWSYNDTHHWHASTCEHSEEVSDYAPHDYDDANDRTCNTCYYVRETATYNMWDGTVANVPADVEGVITITTAEQLAGLAQSVNNGTDYEGITIKLAANINLQNIEWTPIGYGYKKSSNQTGKVFKGTFDGQNYTISNLKIVGSMGGMNNLGSAGVGLFGQTVNAHINNIKVENATVTGNHYVGVIVGFTYFSQIDNCDVNNASVSCTLFNDDENGDKAGIITGYVDDSDLTNCNVSNCTVSASRDAGQLIGCESNNQASDGEEDITTGNSATNVVVSWNNTGTGANIKNEFVGRNS